MNNYQCRKCFVIIQSNSTPAGGTCPARGSHNWTNLGSVGGNNYQCRKCAEVVKSVIAPAGASCPSGGSHNWTKL